jgi:hypothetical protein
MLDSSTLGLVNSGMKCDTSGDDHADARRIGAKVDR